MEEIIKVKARISELDLAKEYIKPSYYWERRKNLIHKLNYFIKTYNTKNRPVNSITEKVK